MFVTSAYASLGLLVIHLELNSWRCFPYFLSFHQSVSDFSLCILLWGPFGILDRPWTQEVLGVSCRTCCLFFSLLCLCWDCHLPLHVQYVFRCTVHCVVSREETNITIIEKSCVLQCTTECTHVHTHAHKYACMSCCYKGVIILIPLGPNPGLDLWSIESGLVLYLLSGISKERIKSFKWILTSICVKTLFLGIEQHSLSDLYSALGWMAVLPHHSG